LGNHLLDGRSPCRVVTEPGIVPRVHANWNYRVPDLGVTCVPPSRELMMPEPVLLIECPRYLFPFARRIIADITAEGGYPPFLLDPIDFAGVYAARKEQAQQVVGHA